MISITVEGDQAIVADFTDAPRRVTIASVRALNRAIASGRTVMVREIARDTGLRSMDVRNALPLREATFNNPSAQFGAKLKRIPLIEFNARGPEPSRGRGRGVSYRLAGGRGRHPNAFIATMATRHRGVFVRIGKARLSIRELFGPSLGRVFRKYRPLGLARVREAFEQNFKHELEFVRSEGAGGSA